MRTKRIVLWGVGVMICFIFCKTVKAVENYPYTVPVNMQTNENTKIYMYDDCESTVLTVIQKGSFVLVVGKTDNGFYIIDLGGAAGFVSIDEVTCVEKNVQEQVNSYENTALEIAQNNDENETYSIYQTQYSGHIKEQYRNLIVEEGISKEEVEEAKRIYNYLPINVTTFLEDHELVCIYTTDPHKYENLPEITSGYTKAVYVNNPNTFGRYLIGNVTCFVQKPDSILHEFGHAVDKTIGGKNSLLNMSQQEEFETVYLEEANTSGLRKYYAENQEEYFAECFRLYFMQPFYLKLHMPQTYCFMKNMIENI